MKELMRRLDRHWFGEASLRDLALARILIVSAQLFIFLPSLSNQLWLASADDQLFFSIPMLKILLLPLGGWGIRPDAMFLRAVQLVAIISGATAIIGWRTRLSLLAFAMTNALLLAHSYSYGEVHHPEALIIMALGLLALGPSGGALSLDDLAFRLKYASRAVRFEPRHADEDVSIFARWPLRTIQWLFVLIYFSAAISKAWYGGIEWFNGYTLAFYFVQDGVRIGNEFGIWMGDFFARHIYLTILLSVIAFAIELTFVVAVLVPRLTVLYLFMGAGLHLSIWLIQRAPFFQYIVLYVVFIENLRLLYVRHVTPQSQRSRLTVLYDGQCPLCIRSMVVLDYLDWGRRLGFDDLHRDPLGDAARPAPAEARHAMHVLDEQGELSRGYYAFRTLARAIPVLWLVLPLMYLPPIEWVGVRVYDRVAAARQRVACTAEGCAAKG